MINYISKNHFSKSMIRFISFLSKEGLVHLIFVLRNGNTNIVILDNAQDTYLSENGHNNNIIIDFTKMNFKIKK